MIRYNGCWNACNALVLLRHHQNKTQCIDEGREPSKVFFDNLKKKVLRCEWSQLFPLDAEVMGPAHVGDAPYQRETSSHIINIEFFTMWWSFFPPQMFRVLELDWKFAWDMQMQIEEMSTGLMGFPNGHSFRYFLSILTHNPSFSRNVLLMRNFALRFNWV